MTLDSSKNLGGIGAILLLVAFVAFFASPLISLIGVVGIIMILIAMHGLADYYKERGIFRNALYSFIAIIVGVIVAFGSFIYLFFVTTFGVDVVKVLYPGFNGDWTTLPSLTPNVNVTPAELAPFVIPLISILAIIWIFTIVGSFFGWQSLKGLAAKSSVSLFSTAGIVLLIGAFLAIVGIGFLLIGIAALLAAIAFFQIKPHEEPPVAAEPPVMQPTPT